MEVCRTFLKYRTQKPSNSFTPLGIPRFFMIFLVSHIMNLFQTSPNEMSNWASRIRSLDDYYAAVNTLLEEEDWDAAEVSSCDCSFFF